MLSDWHHFYMMIIILHLVALCFFHGFCYCWWWCYVVGGVVLLVSFSFHWFLGLLECGRANKNVWGRVRVFSISSHFVSLHQVWLGVRPTGPSIRIYIVAFDFRSIDRRQKSFYFLIVSTAKEMLVDLLSELVYDAWSQNIMSRFILIIFLSRVGVSVLISPILTFSLFHDDRECNRSPLNPQANQRRTTQYRHVWYLLYHLTLLNISMF
jgi:hypothetical protein